jgi:uracil phosphoribosyltransferase
MPVRLFQHPVGEDVLARLRDRNTGSAEFRRLARRLGLLLAAEATRDLPLSAKSVETPLERADVRVLASRVVAIPVLRAGLGMLEAFLDVVPEAEVGYFGFERNEETAQARSYYEKMPKDLGEAAVFVLDPMLATGGSASLALSKLSDLGAEEVCLISVVAAPEGLAHVTAVAPKTTIVTAAIDRVLNERKYILPGLGDFGDRLFGT